MPTHNPRVFTIPASVPFAPTLLSALLDGRLVQDFPAARGPLALAGATLYLPTRRACRLVRDVFLDATGEDAAILPRIVAIGDVDEDEIVFAQAAAGDIGAAALGLPEALDPLDRRLLLARLVLRWAERIDPQTPGEAPLVANHPAAALALADDLGRLIDDMTMRGVPWERLDQLVPDELDRYWQLTLQFLKIAREEWPRILGERGVIDPAARRDALIKAEAARLAETEGPVIAAGSTGSMPATAELLAAIARAPRGAVVMPGLDTDLDPPSWELIAGHRDADGRNVVSPATGHPQFAMRALLARLGIAREEVTVLGTPAPHGRERLVSEALRPAIATDAWQRLATSNFPAYAVVALADVAVIEAATAEEEALAIAVALRETVEKPEGTAALVTPDRSLARRVLAALARWQVAVDDSGGDALSDTPAGLFARLAAKSALGGLAPVDLLALIKHPLARFSAGDGAHLATIAALERAVLRGPRPRPGTAGLMQALTGFRAELARFRAKERSNLHRSDPRTTLTDAELAAVADLVGQLATGLAPFETLPAVAQPLAELASRHREVVHLLSTDRSGEATAFAGNDGIALDDVFDEIADAASADVAVMPADYTELFATIIAGRVVRRPGLPGVRVRLYGPLEARLQKVDRVVLGGLVEGVWPPEARSDAWLNRPMRQTLGLDLPERRISLSAHDFAQAAGASELILSSCAKLAGAPTVTSRFVQRLAAITGDQWTMARLRGERYLRFARGLDRPDKVEPAPKPKPRPPLAARPTALSVTDIEHWLRDPYTIYAKHILKLAELDPIDQPPGAADRGMVIHGAVGDFTQAHAKELPPDPIGVLITLGEKRFTTVADYAEAHAFWWPRYVRIARWFADWERERRQDIGAICAEIRGTFEFAVGQRVFRLSGVADRIERRADGSFAILDYKTGTVPTEPQVRLGFSPQLTLEAAILRNGGFPDIAAGASVAELVYVALKGGEPAGEAKTVKFTSGTPDSEADLALARLREFASRFEDPQQPYEPLVLPMWKTRYGTYDHLARVKEWSALGELDDLGIGP